MKSVQEVRNRLEVLETAKAMFLLPPAVLHSPVEPVDLVWRPGQILPEGVEVLLPKATLESLNAEIAALTWVLSSAQ